MIGAGLPSLPCGDRHEPGRSDAAGRARATWRPTPVDASVRSIRRTSRAASRKGRRNDSGRASRTPRRSAVTAWSRSPATRRDWALASQASTCTSTGTPSPRSIAAGSSRVAAVWSPSARPARARRTAARWLRGSGRPSATDSAASGRPAIELHGCLLLGHQVPQPARQRAVGGGRRRCLVGLAGASHARPQHGQEGVDDDLLIGLHRRQRHQHRRARRVGVAALDEGPGVGDHERRRQWSGSGPGLLAGQRDSGVDQLTGTVQVIPAGPRPGPAAPGWPAARARTRPRRTRRPRRSA